MLVYGKYGQPHLLCYVLHGFLMNPSQDEGPTTLRRQGVENSLKMAQLVPRMQCLFGRIVDLKHVEFGDKFQRNDLFPPRFIDQQIAGNLEEEGLAAMRALDVAVRIGAGHAFGHQIVDIMAARHDAAQARSQCPFMGQDRLLEPIQPRPDRFHVHAVPPFSLLSCFTLIPMTAKQDAPIAASSKSQK